MRWPPSAMCTCTCCIRRPSCGGTRRYLRNGTGSAPLRGRASDPTAQLPHHPLLRSWAQESRELQLVLASRSHTGEPSAGISGSAGTTLLGRLQHDIRANALPAGGAAPVGSPADGDRSVQIHVCYGARRQVEVLRDAILHVLAADSTLEPRDVVIMTPDLATFAPLLEAVFLGHAEPAAGTRCRRGCPA